MEAPHSGTGIFLDRDGTLLVDPGYLSDPGGVQPYPGAAEALLRLKALPAKLVLVTNQSGLGRGLFSRETLEAIHSRMQQVLGLRFDAIYHCPHAPPEGEDPLHPLCPCRKPAPGMILEGLAAFGLDPARCYMVGDTYRDIEAGRAAGLATCLVLHGREPYDGAKERASFVGPDLLEVARWIEKDLQCSRR